jgi:hypothetical protein
MQAELSRAGKYVGVVILTKNGVTVDIEDPSQGELVERVFRDAGPVEYGSGYGEPGEIQWQEFSRFGDRQWFEKVLRSLGSRGYTFEAIKTDTG